MDRSRQPGSWNVISLVVVATVIGTFVGTSLLSGQALSATGVGHSWAKFDVDGNLIKPEGYREWVYVGAPLTPDDMNDGKAPFPEFHSVYIDPDSYRHYAKTGNFRDGTILVKELISVGSKEAPSGNGYFMGDFIGLEATVKDAKRFPKEPANWAYFTFSPVPPRPDVMMKPKAKAMDTESCNLCHQGFAQHDWVFTQYYPVLRAAKP